MGDNERPRSLLVRLTRVLALIALIAGYVAFVRANGALLVLSAWSSGARRIR